MEEMRGMWMIHLHDARSNSTTTEIGDACLLFVWCQSVFGDPCGDPVACVHACV
jgi:hypothetical protein